MVTAVERARKLPEQIAELPVTAASRAVQAGMRLQQRVTELAIKGDEVFSLFQQVEDTPPWARFDEEDGFRGPEADTTARPHAALNGAATGSADIAESDSAGPDTAGSNAASSANDPAALPGYDKLTLAQLRGRLRALSLTELESLLEHEHTHQDRAPFVTMLSNRIVTVRAH